MIDTYETLKTKLTKVDYIVHLSDVHIRLTKRHDEYREVFSKLYEYIKNTPENTLVINTGDIFHSKVDLSPEAVQVASEFLKNIADLRPHVVIAGNHDCLMTNSTRLDSISPIVDNLRHNNLFYLKESKLYGFANILINNLCIFNDHTEFVKMNDVSKKIKTSFDAKIALFHGAVFAAKTDIGYTVTNKTITNGIFDGHDMALLGDIHMIQDLQEYDPTNDKPVIRYAGSLIQQNHGEAMIGHGITLWDVKNRTYTHVEIQNDYGYFTIDIDDGKLMTDITDMPKRPKLRVRCKETIASEVKKVVNEIKKTHDISDIIFMRVDGDDISKVSSTTTLANLQKITDVDYQNKLISECLKTKYPEIMDEDTLKSVHKINGDLNKLLGKEDVSRNIRWKPIKFEFSNMFSYGEGNVIDFTKLEDVYGLFAANASGKSSLMDALCFTMFDKSARAFKAVHVMNTQKLTFGGKFTFEINDVRYVIEREGKRDKKNNVKVDVNFYKLEKEEKISLNSEARRSTNEIVRDYLGDYEDFILTSVALQGNQGSFIDMGQSERKELLSQFIGLNIFDKLAGEANDKVKELSGAIKTFNKESNYNKAESLKNELGLLESKLIDLNSQKDRHTLDKQAIDSDIESEQSKLVKMDNVSVNVPSLKKERDVLIQRNSQHADAISKIEIEQEAKKDEYSNATIALGELPLDLKEKADKHASLTRIKQRTEQEIEKLKFIVKEKLKKIEHLSKHEYDPNCKYCCNNGFVKDATTAKDSLDADKKEAKILFDSLTETKNQLEEINTAVNQYQVSVSLKEKINLIATFLSKKEVDKLNNKNFIDKNNTMIADIDGKIDMYERSKEIIENNKVILEAIGPMKIKSNDTATKLKSVNTEYVNAYSRKVSVNDQINGIEEQMVKIEAYENEIASYQYYTTSVGKDGVPYKIISDAIPRIEQEANNILSQIVEFTVDIETDGKNINVYIKYEDRKWPLELSSGMERFVAALALRVALINVSNLPRANFLVVDEGFGALDASNMAMIHSLFDYLKSNFDFIIVISHLDAMRDMVGKQLEIKKENGFSRIDNTV